MYSIKQIKSLKIFLAGMVDGSMNLVIVQSTNIISMEYIIISSFYTVCVKKMRKSAGGVETKEDINLLKELL